MTKKKISIIISILVVMGIIAIVSIIAGSSLSTNALEDVPSIIWSRYISDENGHITGGELCSYDVGTKEIRTLEDIALDHVSYDGKSLLVGIQNLFPDSSGFKGIVTYDIHTGELREILSCDEIYAMLDENDHAFCGEVQMDSDKKSFYFLCGGKLFLYDAEKEELTVLFDTAGTQCVLSSNGETLYYSEGGKLYAYHPENKETETVLEGVYNFTVSNDEKMIVYENRKEEGIYLYLPETGEDKELFQVNYPDNVLSTSDDNGYLLFTDYKETIPATNIKTIIGIYDFSTGKKTVVYQGEYGEDFRGMLW